jgi:hypothetical protein
LFFAISFSQLRVSSSIGRGAVLFSATGMGDAMLLGDRFDACFAS